MLTGDLVTLRTVRPDDLPILYEIEANLDNWEERSPAPPGPLTREQFDERMARSGRVDFAITVDDRLVGWCNLMHEDALARHASVGISLVLDAVGKGFGTDALRVLIDYAFVRRNLRRLHLVVVASNERAIASYRKVGFVEEGRLREQAWVRGRYEDEVRMGLLRSEWRGR
ncbi:MAG TPA: GNAT family protein [Jatrophihabitantaceae bacterium]